MKPSLLTCACAAALGTVAPAMAQSSSVTLYGTTDVGVLSISHASAGRAGYVPSPADAGHQTLLKDGGIGASNWGMRGHEDLGGGLSASFQLQGNLNLTNGNGGGPNSSGGTSMFNQLAVVGLKGALGEVKLGRQVSPMYHAMAATDARGARYFGSALTGLVALNSASGAWIGNNSNVAFGTVYNDNAVVYTAPTWNNLTVNAAYALGETTGSGAKANSQQTLTAIYNANGLRLSALYYNGHGNNLGTATTLLTAAAGGNASAGAAAAAARGFSATANTNRLTALGGLYTSGPYTVSAQYYMARNPAQALLPGGSDKLDMWTLAGGWRAAPNVNLSAGYYVVSDKKNTGNKATQFAIGAEYILSKRTLAYVQAASVTNKGTNMNMSPVYATPTTANTGTQAYMVGVRHTF